MKKIQVSELLAVLWVNYFLPHRHYGLHTLHWRMYWSLQQKNQNGCQITKSNCLCISEWRGETWFQTGSQLCLCILFEMAQKAWAMFKCNGIRIRTYLLWLWGCATSISQCCNKSYVSCPVWRSLHCWLPACLALTSWAMTCYYQN